MGRAGRWVSLLASWYATIGLMIISAKGLQLAKFQGRPGQLSPKARFFMLAGRVFPSKFRYEPFALYGTKLVLMVCSSDPPFDRHDWIVRRRSGEEVRYVIDYYSLPDDPHGIPVFSLDVRPALDSFSSVKQRISMAAEEGWTRFRQAQSTPQQTKPPEPSTSR